MTRLEVNGKVKAQIGKGREGENMVREGKERRERERERSEKER